MLLIGAGAFGVASLLAAFSTSAEMLIGARALLGVAGATLAPSTLSLIRTMFHDAAQRTAAIGAWITSEVPAGVPPESAEAARDTLGGAVAAAEQLPDPLAGELLDTAREAFIHGLQAAAITSAVIAAVLAVLATVALRRAGVAPHRDEHSPATEEAAEPARP